MARPEKPISEDQVFKLGKLLLTPAEIGDVLGCSERTLYRRFGKVLSRARAHARMSIRRAQYIQATREKDTRMLIHLGRCELSQKYSDEPGGALLEVLRELAAK